MMPEAHTFSVFIGALIAIHISGGLLIAKRLETNHPEFWDKLGRPSLLNWGIANSWRLACAVFFSSSLARLGDWKLAILVSIARVVALAIIATLVVWVVHYHSGQPSN